MEQITTEEKPGRYQLNRINIFKLIILVFHIVGIVGMSISSIRGYFQLLTPFHLLLCTGLLLIFHKGWNVNFLIFSLLAFGIGFGAEVIGVHTQLLFGGYSYGSVLGYKLFEVPLMIGVNWFLLVYLSAEIFEGRIKNWLVAAILGALVMVIMDFLIEPVAVSLDFWIWEGGQIPLTNYTSWFMVALIIQLIYGKLDFKKKNPLALFLLINLTVFFGILNVVLG
jgi:putative membrane protein